MVGPRQPARPTLQPLLQVRQGQGESSCHTPGLPPSTTGEGEALRSGEALRRGEEIHAGGGVDDRLGCWITSLLHPAPRLGEGEVSRGGARVQPLAMGGEVGTPWWLAVNWWLTVNW
jgi:hypothetical protein